jgi:hypothetical protein
MVMGSLTPPQVAAYSGRRYLGGFNDRGRDGLFCFDANGRKLGKPVPRPRDALKLLIEAAKPKAATIH